MKKIILFLLINFMCVNLFSQSIFYLKANGQQGDTAYIYYNDTLYLTSDGTDALYINENFNNFTTGDLICNNDYGFMYIQICTSESIYQTLWLTGLDNDSLRRIYTNMFNAKSNTIILYDLKYGEQGMSFPCEGPDLSNEGVHLQYSLDSGITWTDLSYFTPSYFSNYILWNSYNDTINIIDTNITIRWIQNNFTPGYDTWGIDNVRIFSETSKNIWSTGDTTKNAQAFVPTSSGYYWVKYFNYDNTSYVKDSIYVKLCDNLNVDFTASAPIVNDTVYVCKDNTLTFYQQITGGTPGMYYYWDFGGGNIIYNNPNQLYLFNRYGLYNVKLTATDSVGSVSKNITVVVPSPPNFSGTISDTSMACLGQNIVLTGNQNSYGAFNLPRTFTADVQDFFSGTSPIEATMHISGFPPYAEIYEHTTIENISINLESTSSVYLSVEAPNSNTIEITNSSLYFNWYYLGEAVPNDDTVKGNCYNYTFYENNSINLNKYHEITDNIAFNKTYTINGQTYNNDITDTIPYVTAEPFNNILNSAVNGDWILSNSSANGYICSWSITFDSLFIDYFKLQSNYNNGYWTQENDTTHYGNPFIATTNHLNYNYYNYTVTDNYGCKYDTTIRVFVNACQDVNKNIINNNDIKLYPNPSKNIITVLINDNDKKATNINILNVTGQIIIHKNINQINTQSNTFDINVKNLPSGIYYIKIETDKGIFVKKFIKK